MAMLLALYNYRPFKRLPEKDADMVSSLERGEFGGKEAETLYRLSGMGILEGVLKETGYKINTLANTEKEVTLLLVERDAEGASKSAVKDDTLAFSKISYRLQERLSELELDPAEHRLSQVAVSEDPRRLEGVMRNYIPFM